MTYKFPSVDGIKAVWEIARLSTDDVVIRLYDDKYGASNNMVQISVYNTGQTFPTDDQIENAVQRCITYHKRNTAVVNGYYLPNESLKRGRS